MTKLYAERNVRKQGRFFTDHMSAMTGEGLHDKADIAAELAHRDMRIAELEEKVARIEAKWNLYSFVTARDALAAMGRDGNFHAKAAYHHLMQIGSPTNYAAWKTAAKAFVDFTSNPHLDLETTQ